MPISKKEMIIQIQNVTALLVVKASGLNIGKKESSTPKVLALDQTAVANWNNSFLQKHVSLCTFVSSAIKYEIAFQKQQNICEKLSFFVTFGRIWVKL